MRRHIASGLTATAALVAVALSASQPARAQASGCEELQKLLQQRQSLVQKLNTSSNSKRKMTPQQACGAMGQLVSNGNAAIKFVEANKDWCQIPDTFATGLKADNDKAGAIRNQACNAAKQQATMMRRAQQQAQGAANNPFGGSDSITGGPMRVPQGAL